MEQEPLSTPFEDISLNDIREALISGSPIMDTVNNLRAIFPGGPINQWINPNTSYPDILGGKTFDELRSDVDEALVNDGIDIEYIRLLNESISASGGDPETAERLYRELVEQTLSVVEKLVDEHRYKLADLIT